MIDIYINGGAPPQGGEQGLDYFVQIWREGEMQLKIQPIFVEVIDPNQTTFLPFHYIFDNILLA
jgi:hypothetical protein